MKSMVYLSIGSYHQWIYMLIDNKYELKNSCTLNDKFTSTRFEELEIDLSEVELIVEE